MAVLIDAKEYAYLLSIMFRCPDAQLRRRLNLTQQTEIKRRVAASLVMMAPKPNLPIPPVEIQPALGSPVMAEENEKKDESE